jgi:hypothetical protein
MRLRTLVPIVFAIVVLLFGIYLVSSGGYVGKTYLPSLIGMPNCKTNENASACATQSFIGYGPGTIVCLFGLGLLASTIRSSMARQSHPSMPAGFPASLGATPFFPPTNPGTAGAQPGVRYCPKCARANASDAGFCQQCGSTMPPAT